MKTKLITALRMSAAALRENRFAYHWHQPHSCNNGVLACALTGMSMSQLKSKMDVLRAGCSEPTWTRIAGTYCPIAGQPTDELFRSLMRHGLTHGDIVNLEYCEDKKVLERMGYVRAAPATQPWWKFFLGAKKDSSAYYTKADFVADYMSAWADMLVEEGRADLTYEPPHQTPTNPEAQSKPELQS